jgi:hypothetical protein
MNNDSFHHCGCIPYRSYKFEVAVLQSAWSTLFGIKLMLEVYNVNSNVNNIKNLIKDKNNFLLSAV